MEPMKMRWTFRAVLANGDDQVIVRDLLNRYVCGLDQRRVIEAFNVHVAEYNRRLEEQTSHGKIE